MKKFHKYNCFALPNLVVYILIIGCFALSSCQAITIKGYVQNAKREPVSGASVLLKRTGYVTHTDNKGAFRIEETNLFDTIIISAEGYKTVMQQNNERGIISVFLRN